MKPYSVTVRRFGSFDIMIQSICVSCTSDKPTSTILTSNSSNNTAEFGSTIFLNCTTDAVPKALLFKVFNNGILKEENNNGVFVLSHVNRSNEGEIQCLPYNVLGAGEPAEMNLTVRFQGSFACLLIFF